MVGVCIAWYYSIIEALYLASQAGEELERKQSQHENVAVTNFLFSSRLGLQTSMRRQHFPIASRVRKDPISIIVADLVLLQQLHKIK